MSPILSPTYPADPQPETGRSTIQPRECPICEAAGYVHDEDSHEPSLCWQCQGDGYIGPISSQKSL